MAIANEFLERARESGGLTQMQLQKLAYIAHGWNLAVNECPLISDEVRAWDFGPVFPMLYEHAKYFGSKPIDRLITPKDDNKFAFFLDEGPDKSSPYSAELSDAEKDVIDRVWRRYGRFSAFKLSDLTHKAGTPWYDAYFNNGKNAIISEDAIKNHYLELAHRAA